MRGQKAGGVAAAYLALAFLAAMPYFLLVVDYPGAATAAQRVALIVDNYVSMYAMYLATYVVFGLVLAVLATALHDRVRAFSPTAARAATGVGLLWAVALVTSGMVFTYGMTSVVALAETDRTQAVLAWQGIEPVALGLGGAGGELLGGLWVLLTGWTALRTAALPKPLGWFSIFVGACGLVSVVPPMHEAAYPFGLLLIVWFVWVAVALLRASPVEIGERDRVPAGRSARVKRSGSETLSVPLSAHVNDMG